MRYRIYSPAGIKEIYGQAETTFWGKSGCRNELTVYELKNGNYSFRIKTTNHDLGNVFEENVSLQRIRDIAKKYFNDKEVK